MSCTVPLTSPAFFVIFLLISPSTRTTSTADEVYRLKSRSRAKFRNRHFPHRLLSSIRRKRSLLCFSSRTRIKRGHVATISPFCHHLHRPNQCRAIPFGVAFGEVYITVRRLRKRLSSILQPTSYHFSVSITASSLTQLYLRVSSWS